MTKRFLVTGGLGFVGNEVVRQLSKQGHCVAIMDDGSRVAKNIDDIAHVKKYWVDISDEKQVEKSIEDFSPTNIIHLAALHYIPECNANPSRTLDINVRGTANIMKSCLRSSVNKIVFASSGAVYSDSKNLLSEASTPTIPVDIYGWSKLFCENISTLYRSEELQILAVRLFNVYGPRETNPHIIPEIISQLKQSNSLILGNIDTHRDFIYVKDAARAFIELSLVDTTGTDVVNLGSGNSIRMRELIEKISYLIDQKIQVNVDPSRYRKADKEVQVANTEKLLSIIPEFKFTSFEHGLLDLVKSELF